MQFGLVETAALMVAVFEVGIRFGRLRWTVSGLSEQADRNTSRIRKLIRKI